MLREINTHDYAAESPSDKTEQPSLASFSLPLAQSLLISLCAAFFDFALLYSLFVLLNLNFNFGVIASKIIGVAVKFAFFSATDLAINKLVYDRRRSKFLIISLLSALLAITLINLAVLYGDVPPIYGWLIVSAFVWLATNIIVVFFGRILKILGKSSVSSLTASSVDFMIFNLVLAFLGNRFYIVANLISKLFGATVNFSIHKYWVFGVSKGGFFRQYARYLAISAVSFLLNTGIIKLGVDYFVLNPRLAWPIAGFLVWLCWNFVMTRFFVFKLPLFYDNRMER
ncbi:MAG: hypothetical protein Kow0090_03390 [Myxococcota bacterium]